MLVLQFKGMSCTIYGLLLGFMYLGFVFWVLGFGCKVRGKDKVKVRVCVRDRFKVRFRM